MIFAILVAAICLPINAAQAQIQSIEVTKLVDEHDHKETLFVIATEENTYHIIVRAYVTAVGDETLIDLNATLYNPHNSSITASAQIPDTLIDAPYYSGPIQAFLMHLESWVVTALKIALPVVIVVALILQIYYVIEDYVADAVLQTLKTLLFGGPFIYASLPWILLTLLQDTNSDGSFDLYVPYWPPSPHVNLVWERHYFLATSLSWWEIDEHEVYTDIWTPWGSYRIVWFTYFEAIWNRSRTAPYRIFAPSASFYWTPTQPVVNEEVAFVSTSFDSDGSIIAYNWWLGDGCQRAQRNFTFVYSEVDDYNVTLEVIDNDGLTSNITHTIKVQPTSAAMLRLIPDHLDAHVPIGQHTDAMFIAGESLNQTDLLELAFQSSDFLKNADNYTLSCGNVTFDKNGITITKGSYTNITATILVPQSLPTGWYVGNITATSENGGNATISIDLYVFGPPTANFTWDPPMPEVGEPVTFDASLSIPSGGPIKEYNWDFGDGNTVTTTNQTIAHAYTSHGNPNVTLTIEDSQGLNDTVWKIVNVLQHDVAVVEVTPSRNWAYQGHIISIHVIIENHGDFNETVTVRLYYNITENRQIGTQTVDLNLGENKTLAFSWDTIDVAYCHNYTITALAEIGNDSNMSNNMLESLIRVKVRILGDFNGDGVVGVDDIFAAGQAFGALLGDHRWDQNADLNLDDYVGIDDIFIIASHFGQGCQ
jgi:PKD repeat protein